MLLRRQLLLQVPELAGLLDRLATLDGRGQLPLFKLTLLLPQLFNLLTQFLRFFRMQFFQSEDFSLVLLFDLIDSGLHLLLVAL